jgi:hypothetical protein
MGVFQNNLMGAAAAAASAGDSFYDYQIANSYRSMAGVGYFTRTPSSAGNRKKYTISFWFKRTLLSSTVGEFDIFCNAQESSTTNYTDSIRFQGDGDKLQIAFKGTLSGNLITTRVFRDTSAWMHLVCAVDTTQTTAANRVKLYINGEQETDFDTETYPAQDYQGGWCNDREHALGRFTGASYTTIGNFYMANFALVDGSQLAPTSFGTSKNGVWIPDDLSELTWGTTGTWVRFESSSDLGNDSSGNNNDWTNNSVATHDQMLDSPTFDSSSNGGNFATLNPLASLAGITFTEGNLKEADNNSGWQSAWSTMAAKSGKFYFEAEYTTSARDRGYIGVAQTKDLAIYQDSYYAGQTNNSAGWYSANGSVYINASTTGTTLNTYTTGDILGCAIDIDNGYVYFSKNGTWEDSGDPASGSSGTGGFSLSNSTTGDPWHLIVSNWGAQFIVNYGQEGTFAGSVTAGGNSDTNGYGNFKYTVPNGYSALCTGALPIEDEIDPAQTDDNYPQKLFGTKLYTGDSSTQAITGLGFQPDWVWIKERPNSSTWASYDSSRGNTNVLGMANTTAAEYSQSADPGLESFDSDGFTVDYPNTGDYYINRSSQTYVAFNWRVNGGTTSTSHTQGDIDTTIQVNQDAGLSIVQYQGDGGSSNFTLAHGLGAKPAFVVLKDRDTNGNNNGYQAWHQGLDTNGYFYLSGSDAQGTSTNGTVNVSANTTNLIGWQRSSSSGGGQTISESGDNYVMYVWAEIDGFSKFGRYEGNGNADGTFVYTGFRPALVVNKRIDSTGSWLVHDDARNTYNVTDKILLWNDGGAEFSGTNDKIDMLANGFKIRSSNSGINGSGNDYVYVAFAHNPFKYATAR